MRFVAKSISNYVISEISSLLKKSGADSREMRIILPSLPSEIVYTVGQDIEDFCLNQEDNRIHFVYKVAYALGEEWFHAGTSNSEKIFKKICDKGWYDKDNHLTAARNITLDASKFDLLVIVLIGYDKVSDQASLADFYRLDSDIIWNQILKRSFSAWIRTWLKEKAIEYEDDHVERIDELLIALDNSYVADLVKISQFLENINVTDAQDGRDILRCIVDNLHFFTLPKMTGLVTGKQRQRFIDYFTNAIDFFNYSQFIEKTKRTKAISTIDKYFDNLKDDVDQDDLGPYESIDKLIEDLKTYIEKNDKEAREKLFAANFVFIHDEILSYKPPKEKKKKPLKPKKLAGMPLAVILRGVWITIGEFKQNILDDGTENIQEIETIKLDSIKFRHDCEGDDINELNQNAYLLLRRTIGGIDEYLEDRLAFNIDKENPEHIIKIKSSLCPPMNEGSMSYERSPRAEPSLTFKITVSSENSATFREFIWGYPQTHPYRNIAALFTWIYEDVLTQATPLPVFTVPYFEELQLAKDEDEINRIFGIALQSTSKKVIDLLQADGIDKNDIIYLLLKKLAFEYGHFIKNAYEEGIFTALSSFQNLRKAYYDAYATYLRNPRGRHSQLGPILYKAFFILAEEGNMSDGYRLWRECEPATAITPLHPALLDMMVHQNAYLSESFQVTVRKAMNQSSAKWMNERRWSDIEDLARIQWPIYGTLRGEEQILDTNIRSFEVIHLIGECMNHEASLTTRLLLRYDPTEDDEISDANLFRDTRESRLVTRILNDYRLLHPYADEGITITAYCSGDIQPIIAGIDAFLDEMISARTDDRRYYLSLTLFAENEDCTAHTRWISEWCDRWQSSEDSSKFDHYSKCNLSIAHRLIKREKNYTQFKNLIAGIDADISFLVNFIKAGTTGNQFIEVEPYDHRQSFRKFPVLEKACCSVKGGGADMVRQRIISNRQFELGTLHSEIMARLKNISSNNEYVVMGRGDFSPWLGVVDELHNRSAWVVCIDPSIDERLVAKEDVHGKRKREIIGFGSGVGAHGENNYTISTEYFSLSEVRSKISSHIASILSPIDKETSGEIADSLVKESFHMAGLSLVKATGPSQYIRDFISYSILRKLLPRDTQAFCDEVISLDAYKHWFESAPNEMRPDLLRLKAKIIDGVFDIEAQLIECKLAYQSDRHLEKARQQLENGLNHLIECFKPRESLTEGHNDRPDQRYWWLQLHRLIASKGQVVKAELDKSVSALERLSEGVFVIEWKVAAVTFWTDSNEDEIKKQNEWDFTYEDASLPIDVISTGRNFIKSLCLGKVSEVLPLVEDGLRLTYVISGEETELEDETIEPGATEKIQHVVDDEREYDLGTMKSDEEIVKPALKNITLVKKGTPNRIFLGHGVQSSKEIYWEFGHAELPNRHMLIFGTSGMGKTYAIQALMCELGKCEQNTLIVDYTNGFEENQLENISKSLLNPMQHRVQLEPVPINPFRRQVMQIGEKQFPEKVVTTSTRISSVFSTVYALGDQQVSALYNAIRTGIQRYDKEMSMEYLIGLLQELVEEKKGAYESAASVISKIQPFIDAEPFGVEDPESWQKLFEDTKSRCHILQLAGSSKDFSRLVTEFSLIDLYWYYRSRGDKDHPKVIVLDEVQNLDHRLESPLGQFLTEGRKFGIALILATQTLSNLSKDERDRLFQASHKLFFRPADTEMKSYAQILENATNEKADNWTKRLATLKKGECYSLGPSLNENNKKLETKPFRIRIDSLENRFSR